MNNETSYDALIKSLQMLKRIRRLEGTVMMHEGVMIGSETLLMDWQVNGFVQEVNALIAQYRNSNRPLCRAILGFDGGNVLIFNVVPLTLCLIFGKIEDASVVEKSGEEFLRKWASSLRLNLEGINLPVLQFPLLEDQADAVPEPSPPPENLVLPSSPLPSTGSIAVASSTAPDPLAPSLTSEQVPMVPREVSHPVNRAENWVSFRQRIENLLSKVIGRAQAARLIDRELIAMGITGNAFLNSAQFRPFGQRLISKVKDKSVRRLLETEMILYVEDHCD